MDSWSYAFKRTIAQLVVFVPFLTLVLVAFVVGVLFGIAATLG